MFGIRHLALTDQARQTFRLEQRRAFASGLIESVSVTFLLLIAVRAFHAGPSAKGLLGSASNIGLLLSPVIVYVVEKLRIRVSLGAALLWFVGAVGAALAGSVPLLGVFLMGTVLGSAAVGAAVPLYTHLYQENYPPRLRGQLFSRTSILRIFFAAVFSVIFGQLLNGRIELYPFMLYCVALGFIFGAHALARCPSQALVVAHRTRLFQGFRFLLTDPAFRMVIVSFMLFGSGNFLMVPLRVEYLANERYGLNLSETAIALYVGVLPNLARLLVSPWWGRLFDRMDIYGFRIAINLGFLFSFLTFFFGESALALTVGALVYGAAQAGGEIAWGLWVTRFAPQGRVADYMAVHTSLTGFRGVVMPLLSFQLAAHYSLGTIATVSTVLVFAGCAVLFFERQSRPSAAPVSADATVYAGED